MFKDIAHIIQVKVAHNESPDTQCNKDLEVQPLLCVLLDGKFEPIEEAQNL